jgi:hypothetical protein
MSWGMRPRVTVETDQLAGALGLAAPAQAAAAVRTGRRSRRPSRAASRECSGRGDAGSARHRCGFTWMPPQRALASSLATLRGPKPGWPSAKATIRSSTSGLSWRGNLGLRRSRGRRISSRSCLTARSTRRPSRCSPTTPGLGPTRSAGLPAGGDRTCMLIAPTNPAGSLPPVHRWLSKRSGRRRAVVRAA